MTFESKPQNDEYMATDHVFAVHPNLEAKFANQLEFLKLGLQYGSIGSDIFEAIDSLSMYRDMYDSDGEQDDEAVVEDDYEVEILDTFYCDLPVHVEIIETVENERDPDIEPMAVLICKPFSDMIMTKTASLRMDYLYKIFSSTYVDDPLLNGTVRIGNTAQVRQRSWIGKNINRLLKKPQTHNSFRNYYVLLPPYDRFATTHDGVKGYQFVNQFRYVVTAGIYWAGLKACSGIELTSADILPFRMIANATGSQYNDIQKIKIGSKVIGIVRTGSCASRVNMATNKVIVSWIQKQMVNYWFNYEADVELDYLGEEQYENNSKPDVAKIKSYIRIARNYVVATMFCKFSCTDFMLVHIPQNQLDFSVNAMYQEGHDLYNAGKSYNKRLYTHYKDKFNSEDMALYADYILQGNFFSRLIVEYPDIGEFVDQYVGYFRGNAD